MEYDEHQKRQIMQRFADRRTRQIRVTIPFVILAIAVAIASEDKTGRVLGIPSAYWLPVFLALALAFILYSRKNWRCPACDRYLGRGWNPRFCSKCGSQLRD